MLRVMVQRNFLALKKLLELPKDFMRSKIIYDD